MTVHALLHANTRLTNRHHPEVMEAECLLAEFKLATKKQISHRFKLIELIGLTV